MWMLALLACTDESNQPVANATQAPQLREWAQPHLPGDALVARGAHLPEVLLAEITGPDGVRRTLEGIAQDEDLVSWRPETEWMPGIYQVHRLFGIQMSERFTFQDFGPYQPPQVGDAYRVDPELLRFLKPQSFGLLIADWLPEMWIEVMAVDGDELLFRIAVDDGGYECSAHTASATLSETGSVRWSTPDLTFPLLDSSGSVEDVSIDFDLLGTGLGRLRAAGAVNTSALGVFVHPNARDDGVCELTAQFDVFCEACRLGSPICLGVEVTSPPLSLDTPPWDPAAELPMCAGPTADDIPSWELDCDSGCSSASGSPLFTLLPGLLLLRRRRR